MSESVTKILVSGPQADQIADEMFAALAGKYDVQLGGAFLSPPKAVGSIQIHILLPSMLKEMAQEAAISVAKELTEVQTKLKCMLLADDVKEYYERVEKNLQSDLDRYSDLLT